MVEHLANDLVGTSTTQMNGLLEGRPQENGPKRTAPKERMGRKAPLDHQANAKRPIS